MQILFLWDSLGQEDSAAARQVAADNCEDPAVRLRAIEMASATWAQREVSDRWVERLAPQWPVYRQPMVDRNLLRLAIWELTSTDTPPKVAIDEAIELAKQFSTEQSAAFVNGVLDAVLKEKVASCELRVASGTGGPPVSSP